MKFKFTIYSSVLLLLALVTPELGFSEHSEVAGFHRLRRMRLISPRRRPSAPAPVPSAPDRSAAHRERPQVSPAPSTESDAAAAESIDPKAVGIDLTIQFGPNSKASCQSTPIAKNQIQDSVGRCRIALMTAAHCVDEPFQSIEFEGITKLRTQCTASVISKEYFRNGGSRSREAVPGDSAVLVFDTDCDKLAHVQPVPLAAINKDGETQLDGNKVVFQKRKGPTDGNRGGGRKISADVTDQKGTMFEFFAPTPQGYAIVGGDSGGAVLNEKGQLICPISGSSYEYKRENGQLTKPRAGDNSILDPFTVVCDKRAISEARNQLKRYGMSEDPSQKIAVTDTSKNKSCEAPQVETEEEEQKTFTVSSPSDSVFKALPGLR